MLHYDGPWIAKCNKRVLKKKKKDETKSRRVENRKNKKQYRFNGVQISQPPGGTSTFSLKKEDCRARKSSSRRNNSSSNYIARGTGSRAVMRLREVKKQVRDEVVEVTKNYAGEIEDERYSSYNPYRCTTSHGDGYVLSPSDSHGENLECFEDDDEDMFQQQQQSQHRSSTRRIAPPGGHSTFSLC